MIVYGHALIRMPMRTCKLGVGVTPLHGRVLKPMFKGTATLKCLAQCGTSRRFGTSNSGCVPPGSSACRGRSASAQTGRCGCCRQPSVLLSLSA